jgi:hypothetical protein
MQTVNSWAPKGPSREVRVERWKQRAFYASPCRFFIDVPLDMSGIVRAAVRDCVTHGHHPAPGGMTLVTDAIFRGAALIEITDPRPDDPHVVRIDGEMLGRELPPKGVKLRAELDELVRWAVDLGFELGGCYVQYELRKDTGSGIRATQVYAPISGQEALIDAVSLER